MHTLKGKIGKKKKRSIMKTHVIKWLSQAQFHGANRLADRGSSWYWIPSMILLLIFASGLIYLTIIRYLQNPTFILQAESGHPIRPFPTVFICPTVDFRSIKKEEFMSSIKYPDGINESYIWQVLPQLAAFFSPDVMFKVHDLLNLEHTLKYNDIDIETAGRQLTESCEDILIRCRWKNVIVNCSDIFRMELTSDGFCCIFNGRSLRREMQRHVYIQKSTPLEYTSQFGFSSGLMVAVDQTQKPSNIDLSYKWIALQEGQNFIDPSVNGTPLNPGSEQWVAYYAKSTHITDAARRLGANLRRCTLSEDGLKFFPNYKRKYCLLECEMVDTISRCHCVRIGHPQPTGVPYCTARRLRCAMATSVDFDSCGCLPTCDNEKTSIKSSSFTLDSTVPTIDSFYKDLNFDRVTIVRTFIQERLKKTKQRTSYYSYLDLFSQLGGIFNMFFGCSILTILGLIQLVVRITSTLGARLWNKISKTRNGDLTLSDSKIQPKSAEVTN